MSAIPPWVPLVDTCLKAAETAPTFTYCTVGKSGAPHARTCVSRGWLFGKRATGVLVFTTDRRMDKIADLSVNEAFEACFYFPSRNTQIRLAGFSQQLTPDLTPSLQSNRPMSRPVPSPSPRSSGSTTPSVSPDPVIEAKEPGLTSLALPESYFPVISPSAGVNSTVLSTPSRQEWTDEYHRLWEGLSPRLKASFRYPPPRSLMTKDTRKQLDSIGRGVDGSSDDAGKDNFVVVLMLVNSVDVLLDDTFAKRTLFTRMQHDEWKEQDVTP